MYINWEKLSLNQRVHHVNLTLTLQVLLLIFTPSFFVFNFMLVFVVNYACVSGSLQYQTVFEHLLQLTKM